MQLTPEALAALREKSGLRIDADGHFWLRGKPVENERVEWLFHRGLRWDGHRVSLHVGEQWAYVERIDDVAWFVERVLGGALLLRQDERVPLRDVHFELADGGPRAGCVYADLPDGRRARFERLAQLDLEPLLEEQDGALVLRVEGAVVRVGTVAHAVPSASP
ncbi:MAG: hypothetical protein IV100_33965 [Myxococcales bacterium]|nr:hypothetical protein [Myxococcales bacterium]